MPPGGRRMGAVLSPMLCCGAKVAGRDRCGGRCGGAYNRAIHFGDYRLKQQRALFGQYKSNSQRDIYFFALYRLLEACAFVGLLAGNPLTDTFILRNPTLALALGVFYLGFSLAMLLLSRMQPWVQGQALMGICVDIAVAALMIWLLPQASAGIAMLLLFNLAITCVLLPPRAGHMVTALTTAAIVIGYLVEMSDAKVSTRPFAEIAMFVSSYIAVGYLAARIGERVRSNERLAEQRGAEVADLVEINELVIRRMRTGVLVVDADYRIKLANEAASLLLDVDGTEESPHGASLTKLSPELARLLQQWRSSGLDNADPLRLGTDQQEVQPHFARLMAGSSLSLVFLDDTSVASRRAESLTLAALGRFSASLAHEIRNPLAAINYAVQLLEESRQMNEADQRLLQIIHQQCQRTNNIVESVLGLARRERARAENIDLKFYVHRFVQEFRQLMSIETDSVEAITGNQAVLAMADPRHLQQVLTVLVQNALNYGRLPGEPARVRLRVFHDEHKRPTIDVTDRGPGIPEAVAAQLFRPFFTTSEHGTGLGLYIARELCRSNQATLEYLTMPGGGSCFRITLPGPHTLLTGSGER
jgi:two-component system sensor histidine kinase PilS (NtrC family)